MHCGYFDTTQNGSHSSFVTPTVVGGRWPLFCESDPPPVQNWSYRVTSISYAFGRWHFGHVIHARRIAVASRPAQNRWQCWQLHSGLFGCRQSHGLSAIAELLVQCFCWLHWVHFTVLRCICVFVFSCISLHACCIIVTRWLSLIHIWRCRRRG